MIDFLSDNSAWSPILVIIEFLAASALIVWRLEKMSDRGVEGTVLGTLVMPYCSGLGNIVFAITMIRQKGLGSEVLINSLVNNVTNLTLLIGLPALIWGMTVLPKKRMRKKLRTQLQINRLSLLLTLLAGVFFTGALWALGRDGSFDAGDGYTLVGLFIFWQCFHIYEVLKENTAHSRSHNWKVWFDFALIVIGGGFVFVSVDWLTNWLSKIETGFISADNMGLLTGLLMVIPNAALAFFYSWKQRPDVVYSSQIGDGHICIPFCIGLFAIFAPIKLPAIFMTSLLIILSVSVIHGISLILFGRLPRWMGLALTLAYGYFLYIGIF